jgi:hypothetical protein
LIASREKMGTKARLATMPLKKPSSQGTSGGRHVRSSQTLYPYIDSCARGGGAKGAGMKVRMCRSRSGMHTYAPRSPPPRSLSLHLQHPPVSRRFRRGIGR